MKFKQTLAVIAISAATFAAGTWGVNEYNKQGQLAFDQASSPSLFRNAKYTGGSGTPMVDFEKAATKAAPAVVHIRTVTKAKQVSSDEQGMDANPFKFFFGPGAGDGSSQSTQPQRASGSGVLISADGYIVTNNHVVEGADELMVTLNDKTDFKAKVVGRDPSTDIAVIKIEAHNLPYLSFANSDAIHLGQWVLAIGYPLGLQTTVTSGIVSAMARNIGINSQKSNSPIESFIQTDAAVNPGNSGGALVNTDGDVIGINSAIASPTGSYAGYSYAIPSNLVQKVASDIVKYGSSKRAYLGIMYPNDQMTQEERQKNNVPEGSGVFVMDVAKGSAADQAGVQKGDFVTKVNGATINTGTELIEKISVLHPGDKIEITYQRNGVEKNATATLQASSGTYASVKEQVIKQLGASFENLDANKAAALNIESGVVVKNLGEGILTEQTRIKEGFIITQVNNTKVASVDELKEALKNAGNTAVISGVYPEHPQIEYQYALNDLNGAN